MNRDLQSLLDIYQSAELVAAYLQGVSWNSFLNDGKLQDAVIRRLSIIGEAANRVSQAGRLSRPEIEWAGIRGLRNRLVHEYDDTDLETVWEIAQTEMADLISKIKPMISSEDQLSIFEE
ncbi:MAG: DUF86 domain-containing protein [Phormidesmis sp.]